MKRSMILGLIALAGTACTAFAADVVISQLYTTGGNGGAVLNQDFVELHNITNAAVTVPAGGWSVQYASAAGNFASAANNLAIIPGGTIIPAGGFVLIGGSTGANGSALPVSPDYIGSGASLSMSGSTGKVALIDGVTALGSNNCADARIIDVVGFSTGAAPSCFEGAGAAGYPNNTTQAIIRGGNGCTDTGNNLADFSIVAPAPRNSTSPALICGGFTDCNGNGIDDLADIASGFSLDCNGNQIPDSCDLASGTSADCNSNLIPDSCDFTSGVLSDRGPNGPGNGTADQCEDCNLNGVADSTDISSGTSQDCNVNGRPDECDLANGILSDCNANGIADACEGAIVQTANRNATVIRTGVRAPTNGTNFFNIQGANVVDLQGVSQSSYGGLRWDLAPIAAALDTQFGPANWTISSAYLQIIQSNAAFTLNGDVELYYSPNDTLDFTVGNVTTQYGNFATDHAGRELIVAYPFQQGIINGNGSGTKECYLCADTGGAPNAGQISVASKLQSGTGSLTLVMSEPFDINGISTSPNVAATYAGNTSNTWRGATLVVFATPGGVGCVVTCDFNQDGGGDTSDVIDLADAIAAGTDPFPGSCIDFNQDGGGDTSDVIDMADAIASGTCP